MADEQDRRVEARGAIAGSGMLTDPERIEALQSEAARRERAWRERPKKGFASVLDEVEHPPPHDHPDAARNRQRGAQGRGEGTDQQQASVDERESEAMERAAAAVPEHVPGEDAGPPPAVRRAPPDPRMAALHQLVDQRGAPARTDGERAKRAPAAPARAGRPKKGQGE